ncbi:MAG: hypothetical protein JKY95_12460 [Planctomycetaceae bacterium]|nr:hypothetical protein [Planctomycetaceae bacterium]
MRYLPHQDNEISAKQRAWCLIEIAHRVSRRTGETSLLDQYRAIQGFQASHHQAKWSTEELLRAALSLEILSANQAAFQFAQEAVKTQWAGSLSPTKHQQAILIIDHHQKQLADAKQKPADNDHVEQELREALKQGDELAAKEALSKLGKDRQALYAFVISSPGRQSTQLYKELDHLLKEEKISEDLQAEAYFYLGCLALEAGETLSTFTALQTSKRLAPDSPFQPIRQFYLMQLGSLAGN